MSVYQGIKLKIEITGASHDERIYGSLEGFPEGEEIDLDALQDFMSRRSPGNYAGSTSRREEDRPVIVSGLSGSKTDGTPLRLYIENSDVRSRDYSDIKNKPRPGHADLGAYFKYGADFDMSGGGSFSGRMTAPLCALGGMAKQLLERRGICVTAHIRSIADVEDARFDGCNISADIQKIILGNELPAISAEAAAQMKQRIESAASEGDSVGGVIECAVTGLPRGTGGELFDGIEGRLAPWLFAIPAVKGLEFGSGFDGTRLKASENNDPIVLENGHIVTSSNNAGGILGGISTGMPLLFSVAVKPTPSISKPQRTVDITTMEETEIRISGRHDACIVPRAVPVVEAAAALAVLDMLEASGENELDLLRRGIDEQDRQIVSALCRRMDISERIGEYKKQRGLPVFVPEREELVIRKAASAAGEGRADNVKELYRLIMEQSRRLQEKENEQ